MIKAAAKIILGLIILGIILFLTYVGWWEYFRYKQLMTSKFSSEKWKLAGVEKYERRFYPLEERCGMYHDLTRNYLKKGVTIKEVEDLLEEDVTWSYCANKRVKCITHVMDLCYSTIFIIPMSLHTCFNSAGKLITYDRESHCKIQGNYNTKTKEQHCFKEGPGGIGMSSNDCGIEPW